MSGEGSAVLEWFHWKVGTVATTGKNEWYFSKGKPGSGREGIGDDTGAWDFRQISDSVVAWLYLEAFLYGTTPSSSLPIV